METTVSVEGIYHAGLSQSATYAPQQSGFGAAIYSLGDLNGDGLDDIAIQNGGDSDFSNTQTCTRNWSLLFGGTTGTLTISNVDGTFVNDVVSTTDCVSSDFQFHAGGDQTNTHSNVLMTLNGQSDIMTGWFNAVLLSGVE
jgi:hypothetical protein